MLKMNVQIVCYNLLSVGALHLIKMYSYEFSSHRFVGRTDSLSHADLCWVKVNVSRYNFSERLKSPLWDVRET